MKKISIYLIARISKDAQPWNNKITDALDESIVSVFKPHEHNPWNLKHEKIPKKVVNMDVKAINESQFGLALPSFGRDCAWECGYYAGIKKPVLIFIEKETEWFRDWMIKGGINYVITNNSKTFALLKKDSILKEKSFLINEIRELNQIFLTLYKKHYESKQ